MNPVFVFLVIVGACVLWVLLSGAFKIIGAITRHRINKTIDVLMDDSDSKPEAFIHGFKDSFRKE